MNEGYTGAENLEVMLEAKNYNSYLTKLVTNEIDDNARILDFGAGIGHFASCIRAKSSNIVCVEKDPSQLRHIRSLGIESVEDINCLNSKKFDFIYSLNVLEHIEDDLKQLEEFLAALRPEGKLLIYVPAFMSLYSSMDRNVGHFRRYTKNELKTKLEKIGFTVTRINYADSLGFFASLVFKWFGNNDGRISRFGLILYDRFIFPVSQVLDIVVSSWFGKNVVAIAKKSVKAPGDNF